jgi:hypothetical protein
MKVSVSPIIASLALTLATFSPGAAHQVAVGKLTIGHPWVHEAAEGAPGTYSCIIEIHNEGDEPDRLLGATIEGAGTGVLYKIIETNGHFTSQPFPEGLAIPAHGSVELSPTTYQFKFGKITKALEADTEIEGTLVFEKLHSAPVTFMVEQDDTAPKEDAPLAASHTHAGGAHVGAADGDIEHMRSMMHEMMDAMALHADERIAALEKELVITDAQLPQWNSFTAALHSAANSVQAVLHETHSAPAKPASIYGGERSYPDAGAIKKTGNPPPEDKTQAGAAGSLPARLEDHEKRLAAHLASLKAIKAALDTLYASFSDEQKKIADDLKIGPMGVM